MIIVIKKLLLKKFREIRILGNIKYSVKSKYWENKCSKKFGKNVQF